MKLSLRDLGFQTFEYLRCNWRCHAIDLCKAESVLFMLWFLSPVVKFQLFAEQKADLLTSLIVYKIEYLTISKNYGLRQDQIS